jgi:hypothetical protein
MGLPGREESGDGRREGCLIKSMGNGRRWVPRSGAADPGTYESLSMANLRTAVGRFGVLWPACSGLYVVQWSQRMSHALGCGSGNGVSACFPDGGR